MVDNGQSPEFLGIGEKAAQLRDLGMSYRAIARAMGVSDKTVAKNLRQTGIRHASTFRARDDVGE